MHLRPNSALSCALSEPCFLSQGWLQVIDVLWRDLQTYWEHLQASRQPCRASSCEPSQAIDADQQKSWSKQLFNQMFGYCLFCYTLTLLWCSSQQLCDSCSRFRLPSLQWFACVSTFQFAAFDVVSSDHSLNLAPLFSSASLSNRVSRISIGETMDTWTLEKERLKPSGCPIIT